MPIIKTIGAFIPLFLLFICLFISAFIADQLASASCFNTGEFKEHKRYAKVKTEQ